MAMIECPCIDCICLPLCKSKSYLSLVNDCKLVVNFVLMTPGVATNPTHRDPVRMRTLYSVLKPTAWKLVSTTYKNQEVLSVQWTAEGLIYARQVARNR